MTGARDEGMGDGINKFQKYICREDKKIPEAPSVSPKSNDRANHYSSPVQNSSAGLGGGLVAELIHKF